MLAVLTQLILCQDTILGGTDAQTRFETASKQSNDPPLSRGYTLKNGEDSMKLLELMELGTKLSYLVNRERQLQALVDKKKVIITKTSIRKYLHLEDAGGTDCLPTATIFERAGKDGVLDLEKANDALAKEIAGLKTRVQKLERKKKSRQHG
ncbi:hypothetical protein Tco_1360294 [Tanacetum coccineum]